MSPFDDKPYLIHLAQYDFASITALKNKLLQFPSGTVFKFGSEKTPREQLFLELKTYLESHEMRLEHQ
jgi:hypothetical protein